MLEADKEAVVLMLNTQASELQWDIGLQGLPSLGAIAGDADNVLQHVYALVDRNRVVAKSRTTNVASVAASWIPGGNTPPRRTTNYEATFAPVVAHLCETFQLEPRRAPAVAASQVRLFCLNRCCVLYDTVWIV
jgi:hypothetical protein